MPASLATLLRPRWLQGMVWPTLLLWLYAFALSLVSVWHPEGALKFRDGRASLSSARRGEA